MNLTFLTKFDGSSSNSCSAIKPLYYLLYIPLSKREKSEFDDLTGEGLEHMRQKIVKSSNSLKYPMASRRIGGFGAVKLRQIPSNCDALSKVVVEAG